MYETLVAALRNVNEYDSGYAKLMYDAADAIEAQDRHILTLQHEMMAEAESHIAEVNRLNKQVEELQKNVAYWQAQLTKSMCGETLAELEKPRWVSVTERLPEDDVHVLLSCKCGASAYVCDGFHTEKYSTPTQFYEDIDADYDDETDEYYFPEGWWEVVKNWDDYSCVAIEDTVTHWMPLPEPPKED